MCVFKYITVAYTVCIPANKTPKVVVYVSASTELEQQMCHPPLMISDWYGEADSCEKLSLGGRVWVPLCVAEGKSLI